MHPASTHDEVGVVAARYAATRARSERLIAGLSDADCSVQSMPDASPAKWHLAHTTWFFESFVLRDHVAAHRPFDPRFAYLYNSYYETEGSRHPRAERGLLTRPTLEEVRAWRAHVDRAIYAALPLLSARALAVLELGLAHEEQHQELIVTDLLDLFARNPLAPAYGSRPAQSRVPAAPLRWIEHPGGIVRIGAFVNEGFAFDCESPRHEVLVRPFALASRLTTNAEWLAFIEARGYHEPRWWLSDGWAWVRREQIAHPLRWRRGAEGWREFGRGGEHALDPHAPVTHISHYEASAFASWAGARLPSEFEWEAGVGAAAARGAPVPQREAFADAFGLRWQWTSSAFLAYPGFAPAAGAVGEYNGKFMSGQAVLRGSSLATPAGHSRFSYRNFFYPQQRWQLTGLRLARDAR